MKAIQAVLEEEDPESEALLKMKDMMQRFEERPDLSTTRIDVSDEFATRDAALIAHASQVDPTGFFFLWTGELQKRAWPTEDFQLVKSLVDSPVPETDLFAGITVGTDQEAQQS